MKSFRVAFLSILILPILITCSTKQYETIKIGAILPLTGDAASYGRSLQNGVEVAVNEINNNGGINNKKILVIYEDTKALPATGVSAFRKLVDVDKVKIVIGAATSSVALAVAPIAEEKKIIFLTPLASAPAISKAGDYIFRNVPSDNFGGKIAANFAIVTEKFKTLAILYINNDFGVGLREAFQNEVNRLGGNVVIIESFTQGTTDFRTQLTKIGSVRPKPEAVFVVSYKEAAYIFLQAKQLNLDFHFIGTGLLEDPDIIKIAGKASEGVFFTQLPYDPSSTEEVVQNYLGNFKEKFNKEPDIISAYGYDGIKVLASAMGKSDLSTENIKMHLYEIKNFNGVTGLITIDKNGDVIQPMGIKIIKDGKFNWYLKQQNIKD